MADVGVAKRPLIDRLRQMWRGPGGSGIGVFYLGAGASRGVFMGQAWDFARLAQSVYANPTGYRCVTAIESNFSRPSWMLLPPDATWPQATSEMQPLKDHPLLAVLNRPNDSMSATMMQRTIARDLEMSGRSFWLKMQGRDGWGNLGPVTGLRRLPPQRMTVVGNQDDELVGFVYTDRQGRQYPSLPDSLVFLRYPHPERIFDGMPPALVAGLPAESDTASARFNYDLIHNDTAIPGYLLLKGVTPDQFKEWKAEWDSSAQPGKTRFISADQASYAKVGQTNQELTYSELRQDSQDDIMRSFGVPRAVAFDVSHEALALDTLLPTPTGWTTVGEAQIGDLLFDESGRPTKIVGTTPVYQSRVCYALAFSDGTVITADAGHLWRTTSLADRDGAYQQVRGGTSVVHGPQLRTTAEIAEQFRTPKGRNFRIANAGPLVTEEADLPLAPYVLGAWLGDGFSRSAYICGAEADLTEIMASVEAQGYALGKAAVQGNTYRQSFGSTRGTGAGLAGGAAATMTRMGVLGNKTIPVAYLRASQAQRLELLRGLMDTDGCATTTGRCTFTTVKLALAEQVRELVVSLGMRVRVRETRSRLGDHDCGPAYSVEFSPLHNVFRLQRKVARLNLRAVGGRNGSRAYYRTIADVRRVESVPVRCLEVDSPSHLFLCSEAMIPTHNTYANAEREQAIFMQHNILPKWILVCDELSLQLGGDAVPPVRVALDLTAIDELQDSADAQVERGIKLMGMKAMTINEFRRTKGWPDVDWGDEPMAPLQPMSAVPLQPGDGQEPPPPHLPPPAGRATPAEPVAPAANGHKE